MIQIKRVYENASKKDGFRILVDRLWPRGIKKDKLPLDAWLKDLAPSNELRKAFNHNPKHWHEFQSKYKKELKSKKAKEKIKTLLEVAKKKNLTLVYSAKDMEHNNAVVLKQVLDNEINS